MNNDLISREALKKEFQDRLSACEDWINHTECDISRAIATRDFCIEVIMTINNAPAIEPERPQGEWGKWIIAEIQCPNCFEYFETDCYSKEELNKCPNCGADMRGDT